MEIKHYMNPDFHHHWEVVAKMEKNLRLVASQESSLDRIT
jgi:hypothetical protein